jgi:exosortase
MSQEQLIDSDRQPDDEIGSADVISGDVLDAGVTLAPAGTAFAGAETIDRPTINLPAFLKPARTWGLTPATWIKIAVITALFAALFWPNLRRLWDKTNPFYGEANWGHAVVVPIVGLYYLYVNRERLLSASLEDNRTRSTDWLAMWVLLAFMLASPLGFLKVLTPGIFKLASVAVFAGCVVALVLCIHLSNTQSPLLHSAKCSSAQWFGGYILILGIALFGYAIYPGQNDFLKDFGMVVTLFGVVLALTSWNVMRVAWFPIAFLVCAIPWPGLMYSKIASPLQQMAARVAVWTLEITGVESSAGGTKIVIMGHGGVNRTLNVAEACAGLRSLMTFVSVGAAVSFLSGRPLWQKITVTLSAIPIAISCNVMRISGQGLLDHYVSQQLSENFAHQFVGMIMLIPAFLLILLVGWVLDQIFLEEVDRRRAPSAPKIIRRTTTVTPVAVIPRRNLGPRGGVPAPAPSFRGTPLPLAAGGAVSGPATARPPTTRPAGAAGVAKTPSSPAKPAGAKFVTPPPSVRLASRPKSMDRPASALQNRSNGAPKSGAPGSERGAT